MSTGPFNLAKDARKHTAAEVLTLGDLLHAPYSGWFWLHCANFQCGHKVAVKVEPFIGKWGAEATLEPLRRSAVCQRCRGKGASTTLPGWDSQKGRMEDFPR